MRDKEGDTVGRGPSFVGNRKWLQSEALSGSSWSHVRWDQAVYTVNEAEWLWPEVISCSSEDWVP